MEALLPLATLAGVSGLMLWGSRKERKDGFATPNLPPDYMTYLDTSQKKYNPLDIIIDPLNNSLLPKDYTQGQFEAANNAVKDSVRGILATPKDTTYNIQASPKPPATLTSINDSQALTKAKKCQTYTRLNCAAFDDPNFAADCGMCHEGGRNSMGVATLGGLFVTEDTKEASEIYSKRMNSKRTNYKPTIGTCNKNKFTTTKEDCIRVQKQMECEAKRAFTTDGCGQCYQDGSFKYVEPGTATSIPQLVIAGSGQVTLQNGSITKVIQLTPSAQKIDLPNFKEGGDTLTLFGDVDSQGTSPSIAGYLTGTTVSGEFSVDIIRIAPVDLRSGSKPRLSGTYQVGSDSYNLIRPGRGQGAMMLSLVCPFTFIDSSDEQAIQCASSPMITKNSSAEFLDSSPCYKKGQAPGSYSLECVQDIFTSAGCTTEGTRYPTTLSAARELIGKDTNGQFANKVYNTSLMAYTGTNTVDGSKLDIPSWNTQSMMCTGKSITSPCSIEPDEGPHGADCLNYLWLNKGATDKTPGGIGPTYSGPPSDSCKPFGTLAPITKDGKPNQNAIRIWNGLGGGTSIANVKAVMNWIHTRTMDNSQLDANRYSVLQACHGIDFAQREFEKGQLPPQGADISVLDSKPGRTQTPFSALRSVYAVIVRGGNDYLQISQLVVRNVEGENVAKGAPTQSSGVGWNGWESNAVDGVESERNHPYEYHSSGGGAFFRVNLRIPENIASVTIYNRTDCCAGRLAGYKIQLLGKNDEVIFSSNPLTGAAVQTIMIQSSPQYTQINNKNFSQLICPPGSKDLLGERGRCHKATFDEAQQVCDSLPNCTGVTRDNTGFEPRSGNLDSWQGMTSYKKINAPITYTPATIPLENLQQMFNDAGCTNRLTDENQVRWWRQRPTIQDIQNDMNAYGNLTRTCTGDSRQTQFCKTGSCQRK